MMPTSTGPTSRQPRAEVEAEIFHRVYEIRRRLDRMETQFLDLKYELNRLSNLVNRPEDE
jgi:hypothetical protein